MEETNTFIQMLRARRSVRQFEKRPVEPEKIELLKEAVLRSPSSRNYDPWEFAFVTDKRALKELSRLKPHGSEFLEHAALAIVVMADEHKSDVWVEDCSIASIIALLTAQSLGLGGCWVQARRRLYDGAMSSEDYVLQVLKIQQKLRVLSVIGIGYPAEFPEPLKDSELKRERVHSF